MDEADLAQASIDFHLAHALRRVKLAGTVAPINRDASTRPTGPGSDICEDCGEEILEERRKTMPGCTRCIRCQTEWEKKT